MGPKASTFYKYCKYKLNINFNCLFCEVHIISFALNRGSTYILASCKFPAELAVLFHHAFRLILKLFGRVVAPPVVHVPVLVEIPAYENKYLILWNKVIFFKQTSIVACWFGPMENLSVIFKTRHLAQSLIISKSTKFIHPQLTDN